MNLKGNRTYIVAIVLALLFVLMWYKFRDEDALITGLTAASSMVGMRKITNKPLLTECEQIFGGINKMVDYPKLMTDAAKMVADGMALEAYFSAHPEILTMLQGLVQDGTNVIADLEAVPVAKH